MKKTALAALVFSAAMGFSACDNVEQATYGPPPDLMYTEDTDNDTDSQIETEDSNADTVSESDEENENTEETDSENTDTEETASDSTDTEEGEQ